MGDADKSSGSDKNKKSDEIIKQGFFSEAEVNELLKIVLGVTDADADLSDVIFKMREKQPGWETKAREVLSSRLRELLGLDSISKQIQLVKEDLANYQQALQVRILDLLPEGDLRKRFEAEFPLEKKRIAEYVSEHYFSSTQMCFIQASTFMLHLAEALLQTGNGRGSVIHTNSTVFPWLMLVKNSKYSIYATCGQEHDPLCCGWLFSRSDADARDHINSLFARPKAALNTAFVTPQHITPDGKLHFALEGTSELVETLASSATHLVVLSPLQRIRKNAGELHSNSHSWNEVDLPQIRKNSTGTTEFVLAGKFDKGCNPEDLDQLERFGKVMLLEKTA